MGKRKATEKSKKKSALRYEQSSLFPCYLCNHEFPPPYLLFSDDIICKDRESCKERYLSKYHHYVRAADTTLSPCAQMSWWQDQKRRLKDQGFQDEDVYDQVKHIFKDRRIKYIQSETIRNAEKKAKESQRDQSPERNTPKME